MKLTQVIKKLEEIKKIKGGLFVDLTLYDDKSGTVFVDLDDPDKKDVEELFNSLEELENLLETLSKKEEVEMQEVTKATETKKEGGEN